MNEEDVSRTCPLFFISFCQSFAFYIGLSYFCKVLEKFLIDCIV